MHAQTRTASTTVTNRSLQFLPTDPVFVFGYGTVQTYFTTYDGLVGFSRYDRVAGGIVLGGEVRPRSGATGVYEADYGTYSSVGVLLDTGSFAFQIPTTDSDGNGLPDVVQLDKSGNFAIGGSGLSDNGTPFSASGSLVRSSGSSTETYRVNIVSATGLTNVSYSGAINLLVFSGSVSYQRGSTNSMTVNVRYSLDPANTVTATTNFSVVNSDRIDVPQFIARSSGGAAVTYRAGSLTRQGRVYRGDFQAVDGNPGTLWSDYITYFWEITDPNDSDGNGIPDLSDSIVVAPTIVAQPVSQTVTASSNATFSIVVSGTASFAYQWRKDGVAIGGATGATLPLSNVQSATAGSYTVVISNSAGSVTSNAATLTVVPTSIAPTITIHPIGQNVTAGASVSLIVAASGTAPLSYQWRKDGTAVAGATNAFLTLTNAQPGDAGTYAVVVANAAGSVTSTNVTLTVTPLGPTARLSNLSVRTRWHRARL